MLTAALDFKAGVVCVARRFKGQGTNVSLLDTYSIFRASSGAATEIGVTSGVTRMFLKGSGHCLRRELGSGKLDLFNYVLRYRETNGLRHRFEKIGFVVESVVGLGFSVGRQMAYGGATLRDTLGAYVGDKSVFLKGDATSGKIGGFVTLTSSFFVGIKQRASFGVAMLTQATKLALVFDI